MSQYLSPFHLLDNTSIEAMPTDVSMFRRVKKEILTEFELQEVTTIDIGSQAFDKDALLKFFDQLEREKQLDLHLKVYKNKVLLDFLELGSLDFFKMPHYFEKLVADEVLFKFCLPYFIPRFNEILFDSARKMDIRMTRLLSKHSTMFSQKMENMAFQKTYRYFKGKSLDLEHSSNKILNSYVLDSELMNFLHPSLISIFNLLPSPFFDMLRDEYANRLENLAINLQNTARRTDMAIEALESGLELKTSENTRSRLNHILRQLQPNTGKTTILKKRKKRTSQQSNRQDWEAIAFWVVLIALLAWLIIKVIA